MQVRRRLIALDVDGTLLDSNHAIQSSTKSALGALSTRGHDIVLATARPPQSAANILSQLGIADALFIALNGAIVARQDQIISRLSMGREAVHKVIRAARLRDLHINLMADWDWFIEAHSQWCQNETAIVELEPRLVADLTDPHLPAAQKILLMGEVKTISEFRTWSTKQRLPLYISLSKPNYCEIVGQGISKAHALQGVAKMMGIASEDIIAFGDGENDVELLQAAGVGIAMANSMPAVLATADFVTRSNDDDGIYHGLVHLGLIPPEKPKGH